MHMRRGKKAVLTEEEEADLVAYLMNIQNLGFPLTIGQLRKKVGTLTQSQVTPFTDGVPGPGWVKCFKRRHEELALRKPQALKQKRARNLCPESVASFNAICSGYMTLTTTSRITYGIATRVAHKQAKMVEVSLLPYEGPETCTTSHLTSGSGCLFSHA